MARASRNGIIAPQTGLWRHPDFLRLWGGQTVSQFGSQITRLALPLTAVLTLKASATQMGFLGATQSAAFLLLGLVAGVWVDRRQRRPLLIAADLGRALLLGSIPVVALFGYLRIEQLYLIGFLVGTLTVIFDVAYQSYLPTLVGRQRLVEGNSKLEASAAVAQIAGPGLAGLLVGAVTAPVALAADVASFLWSAAWLSRIRCPEPIAQPSHEQTSLRVDIGAGLRLVGQHPLLRPLVVGTALANVGDSLRTPILVLFMARLLALSPGQIGIVFAGGSIGGLLGAGFSSRAVRRVGLGPLLVGSDLVGVFGMALIPLAVGPAIVTVPLLSTAWFLESMAATLSRINQVSLRQSLVPDRLQGRVNASVRFVTWGVLPVASLAGGALAATIGVRPTLAAGAGVGLLAVLVVTLSPVRRLRGFPATPSAGPRRDEA
ncbi:MAG TPA: MFS transporter [Thermomicrobiales bacterium]|nr:MFS transporter [Thermomicrobiales bacterium]